MSQPHGLPETGLDAIVIVIECNLSKNPSTDEVNNSGRCFERLEQCYDALRGVSVSEGASVKTLIEAVREMRESYAGRLWRPREFAVCLERDKVGYAILDALDEALARFDIESEVEK